MAYRCIKGHGECDGCESCKEPLPVCEICGNEYMIYYVRYENEFVGCDNCIKECDE